MERKTKMISVIVPVYNTEKYLKKCADCILSQTYRDYELILVNDGSTDSSPTICDHYANLDKRIRVLHRENRGPSIARNEGALEATGEYITFIDSDDFVSSHYLQTLIDCLNKFDADISAVKMIEVPEGESATDRVTGRMKKLSGREALLNVLYQKDLDTTPCGMLFKKKIVLDNPFPADRFHEDDFTMFKYFEQARIVGLSKDILYFYVQHESSIMHIRTRKILIDEIEASDNLENYFVSKDEELLIAAKSKKFSNYCQIVLENPYIKKEDSELYNKLSSYLIRERQSILFNKRTRGKNKLAALILYFGNSGFEFVGRIFQ